MTAHLVDDSGQAFAAFWRVRIRIGLYDDSFNQRLRPGMER